MELSFGEMLVIVLVIVMLFGPDKLPQIARDLGQGVRKMRGAMEDIKTEILKETDNPVAEIKREIDKVKDAAKDFNPVQNLHRDILSSSDTAASTKDSDLNPSEDESHMGPVSR